MGKLLGSLALSILVGCGGGLEGKVDDSASRVDVLSVGSAPHGNIDASINRGNISVSVDGGMLSNRSEEQPSYWCDGGSNGIGDWFVDYVRIREEVGRNSLNKRMKRMYKLANIYHSRAREALTSCRLSSKNVPDSVPALGSALLHLVKGIESAAIKGYLETAIVLMEEVRVQQWERQGIRVGDYFDLPGGF